MADQILKKTATGNYTADSVKKYVQEIKELYDRDFSEQRERLTTLRDENRRLREEVSAYRQKEYSICAAVLKAEQMAEKIIAEAEFAARKRMVDAEDFEKKSKRLVDSYIERLFSIEKNIAELLNEAIRTTSTLKESGLAEVNEAYGSAADIYHIINGLKKASEESEAAEESVAV